MKTKDKYIFSIVIVLIISLMTLLALRIATISNENQQAMLNDLQLLDYNDARLKEQVFLVDQGGPINYDNLLSNLQVMGDNTQHLKNKMYSVYDRGNHPIVQYYDFGMYGIGLALLLLLIVILNKPPTTLKKQQKIIEHISEQENLLSKLFEFSFQPLDAYLQQAGTAIISQHGLQLQPCCAIFIQQAHDNKPDLKLACNLHLTNTTDLIGTQNQPETYICKDSAAAGEISYTSGSDQLQLPASNDQAEYKQYNLPIIHGQEILGVIVLFPSKDLENEKLQTTFLKRIADVMSMGLARKLAEQKIEYLACHDILTQLPNRLLLINRLEQVISLETRRKQYSALLYIDLDRFKNINDGFGHLIGDAILIEFANRVQKVLLDGDTLARMAGNEFVVLITEISGHPDAAIAEIQIVQQKIKRAIKEEFNILGQKLYVTFSAGIVLVTGKEKNPDILLKQAHTALTQAKSNGCDSSLFFMPEMQSIASNRVEMEKDLRLAIANQELEVFYQPQVNDSGQIIAAEALLRWHHDKRGFVSPVDFIPIAEDCGLIIDIGKWVLEQVCVQIKKWQHISNLQHIAINVSPVQFKHTDFVDSFKQIITHSGINANKLLLELTEGILVDNVDEVIEKMNALKSLGIHFSIDDFGTGYSSLAYLKRFPLDQIKIDKSFVEDISHDENNRVIIETIIAMTERMGFSLIAEGVETNEQLNFLKQKGCNFYQGFYFNRPLPVDEFNKRY